jgi:hypothetical protein
MKKVWEKFEQKYLKLKKAKLPDEVKSTKRFFEVNGKFFVEYPDGLKIELIPVQFPLTEAQRNKRKKWKKKWQNKL